MIQSEDRRLRNCSKNKSILIGFDILIKEIIKYYIKVTLNGLYTKIYNICWVVLKIP